MRRRRRRHHRSRRQGYCTLDAAQLDACWLSVRDKCVPKTACAPKKKLKPKDAVMEAFVKQLTQPYAPPPPRPPASDLEESDSEVVDTT